MTSVAICAVATPGIYEDFARDLFRSAEQHFHPGHDVTYHLIETPADSWPAPTLYRHHRLLDAWPDDDWVFLLDADLLFVGEVGAEILPEFGTVAVQHPGYVGKPYEELPYEKNPESAACVPEGEGWCYYAGGVLGGTNEAMHRLSFQVACCIEIDMKNRGTWGLWHDESATNRVLASQPPEILLSPAYLHPTDDAYYVQHVWSETYPRLIEALDKAPEHRVGR